MLLRFIVRDAGTLVADLGWRRPQREWCFAVIFSILAAAFDECKMCPLLANLECVQCDIDCVWDNACNFKTSTGGVSYTKWNGFFEIGQTHVVRSESFTFPKSEYDT